MARALERGVRALVLLLALPAPAAAITDGEFLRLLAAAEAKYAEVHDYTATMVSVERVGETLIPERRSLIKFQRPFKVYMRWVEGPGKGREGLYVAGGHNGKFLIAEPGGIARFVLARLDPLDPRVMEQSRHPITDVGIGRLLEMVGENTRRAVRERVVRWSDHGVTQAAGRRARQVEGVLPRDPAAGFYGYRVTLWFDDEHGLPIRVVTYDWKDRLVEDYTYADLVLNPGLKADDFDPGNPDYGFSRWRLPLP
jgi:outer membrane lipoprotein-sorting protein